MKIIVASENTEKIEAVERAFLSLGLKAVVKGRKVDSGVSDFPSSHEECILGVNNRIDAVSHENYDFYVAIESGKVVYNKLTYIVNWCKISDKEFNYELTSGFSFANRKTSEKSNHGIIGALTKDALKRKDINESLISQTLTLLLNSYK